jgi:uncharacterized membrane protein
MSEPPRIPRWSLKAFLFTGLAALLPSLLLALILVQGFNLVHALGGSAVAELLFPPRTPLPFWERLVADLISLALLITLTLGAGLLVRSVFGRQILDLMEQGVQRIPLVNRIYPALRQLTDFMVSNKRPAEFQRVVAIPYPHPGVYSVGFVTGEGLSEIAGGRLLTVFVPCSPLPFTGWICLVPAEQATPLRMTVEEAIRFCVSVGVSRPGASPQGISAPRP